ncbi:MAG: SPOR domain-containing protein [Desulfobacterales bacterium]|nr:SPOR domain-containing protein [Desulfobacterales bacterium]
MNKATGDSSATRGPMGLFGWLWTVFLVSGAMFVLGVLVGRGSAPVEFNIDALQEELATLKAQALEDESKRFRIDTKIRDGEPGLDFHEALKTRRPKTETLPEKPKPPEPMRTASTPRDVKPAPATAKTPSSPPPALSETRPMTLQVASLKDDAAADRIVQGLAAKGYAAYRVVADLPNKGRWYRVRVGAFKDADEAALIMGKLKKEGREPILVKRE